MGESEFFGCRTAATCPGTGEAQSRCPALAQCALASGGEDARAALGAFFQACWPRVHALVRAQGYRGADAEDLTQAYFTRFLERGDLPYLASWRGCVHTFLRVSVRHFLANERDRERAAKRGGGRVPVSLDARSESGAAAPEPVEVVTPETLLAHRQADETIAAALAQLRSEMEQAGRADRFARVEHHLLSDVSTGSYRRIAREWGVGQGAVRIAVHRFRRRLAVLLRQAALRPVQAFRGPGWAALVMLGLAF